MNKFNFNFEEEEPQYIREEPKEKVRNERTEKPTKYPSPDYGRLTGHCIAIFSGNNFSPIGGSGVCFEQAYWVIDSIVEKRRSQWKLNAMPYLDFDDVKSVIITHIYKKWHLYDQSKPLGAWVATVAKTQMINMLRNLYMSTAKPCARCPANMENKNGDSTGCAIYGTQGPACKLYAKWESSKKNIHSAKMPLPMEHHSMEVFSKPDESLDIERALIKLHPKMKEILTDKEWTVYTMIYINGLGDDDVAEKMGYKMTEKGNGRAKNGYRRLRQIESSIIQKAKDLIREIGYQELL